MNRQESTIVSGAGPAGMALALKLTRNGQSCRVYERFANAEKAGGHFFTLSATALGVLRDLGVDVGRIIEQGTTVHGLSMLNGGAPRRDMPLAPVDGLRHTNILRPLLMESVSEAAATAGVDIKWQQPIVDIAADEGGVVVSVEGGAIDRGTRIIGCEGLRSITREAIFAERTRVELEFKQVVLYATTKAPIRDPRLAENNINFLASDRGTLGVLPATDGTAYWFARFNMSEVDPGTAQADTWREAVTSLDVMLGSQLVDSTDTVAVFNAFELNPLPTWSRDGLHIIGDAAHAMSPASGRGASLAIEDANLVADCLLSSPHELVDVLDKRRRDLATAGRPGGR